MKWSEAVRKWNESRGWVPRSKVKWVTPKKGSAEHAEVRKLMKEVMEASASTAEIAPMPMIPQPVILSGTVSSMPAMMSVAPDVIQLPMRRKKVVPPPAPVVSAPIVPVPISIIGKDIMRRTIDVNQGIIIPDILKFRHSASIHSRLKYGGPDFVREVVPNGMPEDKLGPDNTMMKALDTKSIMFYIKQYKQQYHFDEMGELDRRFITTFQKWVSDNSLTMADGSKALPVRFMRAYYDS